MQQGIFHYQPAGGWSLLTDDQATQRGAGDPDFAAALVRLHSEVCMATTSYDPTNDDHRTLAWKTDDQLRKQGMSDDEIAKLRKSFSDADPDTSPPASSPTPIVVADTGKTAATHRPRRTGGSPDAIEHTSG